MVNNLYEKKNSYNKILRVYYYRYRTINLVEIVFETDSKITWKNQVSVINMSC